MSKKQVRQMIEELTAKLCAREFLAASNREFDTSF